MDTSLLRAVLVRGDGGRQGWEDWRRAVGDPVTALGTDTRRIKVLVPLLADNLRANAVDVPRPLATYSRAAHLTETMRMNAYLRECGRVLTLLDSHGVGQVVMKGAALAATVYASPALRHAHDFDVLLRQPDLARGEQLMRSNGFSASRHVSEGLHHLAPLTNALGFAVELHRHPAQVYPRFDATGLWNRSVPARVAGCDTRVPARADSLLLATLHAATGGGSGDLRWVCDIWLLAEGMSLSDWNLLADTAFNSSAALPLALVLGYVSESLGAVVPADILARITDDAARTDGAGRKALTFGARQSMPQDLHGILQMDGSWRDRFEQLAWRLAPPPDHVRLALGYTEPWQVLSYYPARVFRLSN
ncbi:MAG: nucleotidyltransferase family protein [Vicinamibacterales bacterium]